MTGLPRRPFGATGIAVSAIDPCGLPWEEASIRFGAWQPAVAACVVGTANLVHLRRNLDAVSRGPLPEDLGRRIRDAFSARGSGW
jgi:aryl-alcohol dehydrogenase-like predicted oxidoreductase